MPAEIDSLVAERPTGLPEDAPTTSATTDSGKPTGSVLDGLLDPAKVEKTGTELLGARREMGEQQSFVDRQLDSRMERDRDQMQQAYKAEGAAASALPPKWDADRERADRIRGPMEQFGSVGSIFAMAASMFTKTPMNSALNAGAAAMKAIQESDEKNYESAYKAWKDNTDLALKRFGMEHQMFSDADHLLTTDMSAWAIKQKAIAARFENNQAMILLENGMYKELIDVQTSQVRAASELVKAKQGMEEFDIQHKIFADGVKAFEEEHPEATEQQKVQNRLQLLHEIKSGARSWQQEALRNFEMTHPDATPEQRTQFMQSLRGGAGAGGVDQEFSRRFYQQNPNATPEEFSAAYGAFKRGQKTTNPDQKFISEFYQDHPEATAEEFSKAFGEWKKGQKQPAGGAGGSGNTTLTMDRQNAAAVAKQREVWKAEGKSDDEINDLAAKMYARLKGESTPITATNRDQLDSMITRIDTANQAIDKVEALLKKHGAMPGLGGKITRPAETISNWFGSNETDRAQFRRYIEELRELGPRLLQESKSRPLSSEEKRIAAIVPGLDMGDTTANTARGLKELQDLFKTLRAGLELRRKGEFEPSKPFGGAAPGESKPARSEKAPWESAPIKTPASPPVAPASRSDAGSDDALGFAEGTTARIPSVGEFVKDPAGLGLEVPPKRKQRGNLSDEDILSIDVQDIPEGMSAREFLKQLRDKRSELDEGRVVSDADERPIAGEQYAGGDLAIKLAVQNLRRQMGVSPSPTGNKATDEALKAIDEALKLLPKGK